MKFALVNGIKKIAEPEEVGICICCNNPVKAYCGLERVHHWKHISAIECDSWSEGETEWHREWKNHFNLNQQEVIQYDPITGEKHIADVFIESLDLVLEFQHSPIDINEIKARESFYKKMIWIVDIHPYKDSISFHRDIGDAFNKCKDVYWESRFRRISEVSKQGKHKEVAELIDDDHVFAYFENIENRYFPDYFEKKSKSDTANNLLVIIEKEKKKVSQDLSGYFLSEEHINLLKERVDKHLDQKYLLMVWKNKHKRWNHAKAYLFFDIGDEFVYRCIENIQYGNGFIVRQYSKEHFISHYTDK